MELLFLGTGAGMPSRARNVSSLALKLLDELNEVWLFDCGEATQQQILETSLKPRKVKRIFITHMHGDHIFGLPGFLSSRSFQGGENDTLHIYGPAGIRSYVLSCLKFSQTKVSYQIRFHELDPAGGFINLDRNWKVEYLPVDHGILSIGYRIIEPDYPGELLVDKLKEANVPSGPIYGQLKAGKTVKLDDGRVLDGKDFIAPSRRGRIITIIGDTREHPNTVKLAYQADVLVHEATHGYEDKDLAYEFFHSTNVGAAQVGQQAQVKRLYLNHISSRYSKSEVSQLEEEARQYFPQTTMVWDFDEFEIPRP